MRIITIATLKGGSGKSMNVFNIGGMLAEKHKVLLIDVDPQCNLSLNCGVDSSDPNLITVNDIFTNFSDTQPTPDEVIFKAPIDNLPNLDIIPSSIMLFDTEMHMGNVSAREFFLKYYIYDNQDYFENNYDYILIDTNPSMSIININAFYIADSIILTSDISANSISGAELFCSLWDNKRKPLRKENNVDALIICNVDRRTNLGKNMIDYSKAADFSQDLVLNTVVPTSVVLKNTEIEHLPINVIEQKHNKEKLESLKAVYSNIIAELKEKGVL